MQYDYPLPGACSTVMQLSTIGQRELVALQTQDSPKPSTPGFIMQWESRLPLRLSSRARFPGMGPSRMGEQGLLRFLRTRAIVIQRDKPASMAVLDKRLIH